jgi:hypothetical protein
MARYYAKFDQGNDATLDSDYFDKLTIGAVSASSALLRDGLIASRSALSNALRPELNQENEYGTNGPIIPREIGNITQTGAGGTLSWNNVYTSSTIPGIITPADYRTRPTGSPTTTDGNLTARSPADPGTINNDIYLSASNALTTVLNNISSGRSPLTPSNQGNFPTRSLHSLWHDKNLQYFAWDDFTPGQPTVAATSFISATGLRTSAGFIDISITSSSLNDFNPFGTASLSLELYYATSSNNVYTDPPLLTRRAKSANVTIPISSLTGSGATRTYRWVTGTINTGSLDNDLGFENTDGVILSASVTFTDPVANLNSQGVPGKLVRNTGANITIIKNNTSYPIPNGAFIKIGSA